MHAQTVQDVISRYFGQTYVRSRGRHAKRAAGMVLRFTLAVLAICLAASTARAQTSSGTISGHVVDQTGAIVAGAQVNLINQLTGAKVATKVSSHGDFTFPDVQPGTFTVNIQASGYKTFEKKDLRLSSSERLSAGTITLQVGTVTESVTVSADITPIQTNSAERSGLLDTKQMENLLTSGRDFTDLLHTIPGVVKASSSGLPQINGVRNTYNSASVDGVTGTVREGKLDTSPNLDDIAEVKVLSANYQAEYGKATGGSVINIVTKNGTRDFHGTLYYYMQNEALNANSWFNKYNGQPRPKSRHNTIGGNIGGPIYWPGHFNTNKNKLFFFYSMEILPNRSPGGLKKYTVPTALERTGDFSQTYNSGVKSPSVKTLIRIKDPSSSGSCSVNSDTPGPGCFPDNKIPADRIDPSVLALLNLYPMPNFSDLSVSANKYNYVTNYSKDTSSHQEVFRVDYIPTEKLHIFGRGELEVNHNNGYNSTVNPAPWLISGDYKTTAPNFALDATYTFSPTVVNEITLGTAGWSENNIYAKSQLDKLRKGTNGYNLAQLYPDNNPLNLLPGIKFGLSSSADIKYDSRFPLQDQVRMYSLTDSVTKVWGRHIIKLGIDLQTDTYLQSHAAAGQPEGAFDFSRSTNNPNDSNFAYANALLGNFNNYTEPNKRFDYKPTNRIVDWYAQDQWKVTNKLTLDYGVRFLWSVPSKLKTGANFVPAMYDPAKAPVLYVPTTKKDKNGKPEALDPTTGEYVSGAYGGLFVPNTGDLTNGTFQVNTPGLPSGLIYGNGILPAPRLGFAYDPFGQGKTVIRGGAGIFYNEGVIKGQEGDMSHNPPNSFNPEQFYGNVNGFLTAGGLLGPPNVGRAIDLHIKQTSTINASLGIQQQVGFGTVLDVAYVGTFGRHLSGQQNINEVPYGAHFVTANQVGGKPLPDNFYRKYPGYGSINYQRGFLTSNYNALQVQVTRRFHNGLEYGLAYTWAKSMDFADSYDGSVPLYDSLSTVYGPGGDDYRHNLVMNYLWSLPKGSRIWNNFATRAVLDNWQISGIVSYLSGAPEKITFSTTDGADITGGGDSARAYITGDPNAGAQHTFLHWFNTSVVHRPSPVTVDPNTGQVTLSNGNAPKVSLFDPGVMNFDTALFKNIPVAEGRVAVQFRAETYNTLNHPEFNSIDVGAKFDPAGNQVNDTFGQINGSEGPRTMQLALRINF